MTDVEIRLRGKIDGETVEAVWRIRDGEVEYAIPARLLVRIEETILVGDPVGATVTGPFYEPRLFGSPAEAAVTISDGFDEVDVREVLGGGYQDFESLFRVDEPDEDGFPGREIVYEPRRP